MRHLIRPDHHLSASELESLKLSLVAKHDRNSMMIRLLLETGLRASELLNLKLKDLLHDEQGLQVSSLKGSMDRSLPLRPETYQLLLRYLEASRPVEHLFEVSVMLRGLRVNRPLSLRTLQLIWHKLRPHECTKRIHSLRHTFAVELFKACRDTRIVQQALGHVSIQSTMVYATYVDSFEDIRKALLSVPA